MGFITFFAFNLLLLAEGQVDPSPSLYPPSPISHIDPSPYPYPYTSPSPSLNDCCAIKTVGGVSYSLVDWEDTSDYSCKNDCVYERDDQPGSRVCFANGPLPVECSYFGSEEEIVTGSSSVCFGPVGGIGGVAFSDEGFGNLRISTINMAIEPEREAVTNFEITYGLTTRKHGSASKVTDSVTCPIDDNETIVSVTVQYYIDNPSRNYVASLIFITSDGNQACTIGATSSRPTNIRSFSKQGCHLSYFKGRAGVVIDQLTFCFECP